jgi:Domain of unknown function (DUF5666)
MACPFVLMTDSGTAANTHGVDARRLGARTQETSMTTNETEAAVPDAGPPIATTPGVSFSGSRSAPSRLRIGLVLAGAVVLIVAAAATSLAASPGPSSSSNGGSGGSGTTGGSGSGANGGAAGPLNGPGFFAQGGIPGVDDPSDLDLGRLGRIGVGGITITAIDGNQVTLGTPDDWHRTITITSSVKLTKGGQDITLADLKVGDHVRIRQTRNADGTYTVTALAVVVPSIQGNASAITSGGFKVTTRDGSVWTVTVNGSTTYSFGLGTGSLADVKDGQPVRVTGNVTGDNQMTALNVKVAGDRAAGTVGAKTADTITIKKRDGSSVTIHVDADTTFRVAGVQNAKLSDVAVGMAIGITGRARADGSIDADAVVAGNLRGFDRGERNGAGNAPAAPGFAFPNFDAPDSDDGVGVPTA